MFDVRRELAAVAARVEERLPALIPEADPGIGAISDAMCYAALGGGKRIRPSFTLSRVFRGATPERRSTSAARLR